MNFNLVTLALLALSLGLSTTGLLASPVISASICVPLNATNKNYNKSQVIL
jgi:hypothetical protein